MIWYQELGSHNKYHLRGLVYSSGNFYEALCQIVGSLNNQGIAYDEKAQNKFCKSCMAKAAKLKARAMRGGAK